MKMKKDYYGALGVDRDAKPDVIRQAYLGMVQRFHPDLNPGDKAAAHFFREVQEAYEVLSDQRRREAYDRAGTPRNRPFREPDSNRSAPPRPEPTGSNQDPAAEAAPDAGVDNDWASRMHRAMHSLSLTECYCVLWIAIILMAILLFFITQAC